MADVKISALPAGSAIGDTDVLPATQSGVTNKVTGAQVKTYAQSGLATVATTGAATDLTGTLGVAHGGTGATSLTAHGVLLGEGTGAVTPTAAMTNGQLLVGQSAADPLPKTVSGDATMAASGALTVTKTSGSSFATVATSGSAADLTGTLAAARLGGMSVIQNQLSGDVSMPSSSTFYDGPSIAQGASGTWWVAASVSVVDTVAAANFIAKLWDGTTVIASGGVRAGAANQPATIALVGMITSPAGNLKVSIENLSSTTGAIKATTAVGGNNASGIQAIRIG